MESKKERVYREQKKYLFKRQQKSTSPKRAKKYQFIESKSVRVHREQKSTIGENSAITTDATLL